MYKKCFWYSSTSWPPINGHANQAHSEIQQMQNHCLIGQWNFKYHKNIHPLHRTLTVTTSVTAFPLTKIILLTRLHNLEAHMQWEEIKGGTIKPPFREDVYKLLMNAQYNYVIKCNFAFDEDDCHNVVFCHLSIRIPFQTLGRFLL